MKHQALFSSKDKSKKLKYCLLQFLFSALRVNLVSQHCCVGLIPIKNMYQDSFLHAKKLWSCRNGQLT